MSFTDVTIVSMSEKTKFTNATPGPQTLLQKTHRFDRNNRIAYVVKKIKFIYYNYIVKNKINVNKLKKTYKSDWYCFYDILYEIYYCNGNV